MHRFGFGKLYRAVEEGIAHVLRGPFCLLALHCCAAILAFAAEFLGGRGEATVERCDAVEDERDVDDASSYRIVEGMLPYYLPDF